MTFGERKETKCKHTRRNEEEKSCCSIDFFSIKTVVSFGDLHATSGDDVG
jgi:hypothetical protein